jgi:DNA-binding phage protein
MLRSAYAVSRSARVHTIEDLRCLKSTERIEALLNSALQHHKDHEALKANSVDYLERIESISKVMREEHFKQERLEKTTHTVLSKVNKNKKENALQQKTGVDRTHAVEGLFPYGKLVKRLHFDALKTELLFRGCSEQEVNDLTITQRKKKLKELECKRLKDWDHVASAAAKEAATRAFKPLSGALFPAA